MATEREERDILYATDAATPQIEPERIHPGATITSGPGMRPPTERAPMAPPQEAARPRPAPPARQASVFPWPIQDVEAAWRDYVAIRPDRKGIDTLEERAGEMDQARAERLASDASWLSQYLKGDHLPIRAALSLVSVFKGNPIALRRRAIDYSIEQFDATPVSDAEGRRLWAWAAYLASNLHRPFGFALAMAVPIPPAARMLLAIGMGFWPIPGDPASQRPLLSVGRERRGLPPLIPTPPKPRERRPTLSEVLRDRRAQRANVAAALRRAEEERAARPYDRERWAAIRRGDTREAERLWQLQQQHQRNLEARKRFQARQGKTALTR